MSVTIDVLFCWEHGQGNSYVLQLAPLIEGLIDAGDRVAFAANDLRKTQQVLADVPVLLMQAPTARRTRKYTEQPVTYADILYNLGYFDTEQLSGLVRGWQSVFELTSPRLIVFIHSPTAMLAARGSSMTQVTIGSGFLTPLRQNPQPPLFPWRETSLADREEREHRVVEPVNQILRTSGRPEISSLGEIYAVTRNLLTTVSDLDHYGQRTDGEYVGTAVTKRSTQATVEWPGGDGPRIFAYLKSMPALCSLVEYLARTECRVVLVTDSVDEELPDSVSIVRPDGFVDVPSIAGSCDFAILNGTHGATLDMLLAGVPILQIPLNTEQAMLSERCINLGVAHGGSMADAKLLVSQFESFCTELAVLQVAADTFAKKFAAFNRSNAISKTLNVFSEYL